MHERVAETVAEFQFQPVLRVGVGADVHTT
jgi:hypothetical protein